MILKIFAIRDIKAEAYFPPFFLPTPGLAERQFSDMVNNPDQITGKYPEDFTLYYLGEFNDHTGDINPLPEPTPLAKGKDLVAQTEMPIFEPEAADKSHRQAQ